MRKQLKIAVILVSCMFLFTSMGFAGQKCKFGTLENSVKLWGVKFHQKMFEHIAEQNDGHRAAGTPGYDQSVAYVKAWLQLAGYDVQLQEFEFPFFEELSDPELERIDPDPLVYSPPKAPETFYTMRYSGSGEATGFIQGVDIIIPPGDEDNTSTSGCEPDDFINFESGRIALIQRGSCTFYQKAINAQNAGAIGVIIFNEGQPGRIDAIEGNLGGPDFTIPVLFVNYNIGEDLYTLSMMPDTDVEMRMKTDTDSELKTDVNVLADSKYGDETNMVVVGGHLDSVQAGAGINDNGSGSACILEAAVKMGLFNIKTKNKIRFAWWGAEELGLHGSENYVAALTPEELANTAMNLNFDMVASPNYVRFVYDGDGSDTPVPGPAGSDAIEQMFVDYFTSKGLETDPTGFGGNSDYAPFFLAGIPVGGLFTGAGGIKTEEQAAIYGGTAGEPYDPYYHTPGDTNENVNLEVEKQMLKAIAHAIDFYGENDLPAVPAVETRTLMTTKAAQKAEFIYHGPFAIR